MEINSENIQMLGWVPIYTGTGAEVYQYKQQNISLHWRKTKNIFHLIKDKDNVFTGMIENIGKLTEIMKVFDIA